LRSRGATDAGVVLSEVRLGGGDGCAGIGGQGVGGGQFVIGPGRTAQRDLSAALTSDKLATIYVPVYESDGTTQSTNAAGAKLYTKYTLNTSSLPTGITFGSTSLALTYNAAGSYALTSGSSTMTAQ